MEHADILLRHTLSFKLDSIRELLEHHAYNNNNFDQDFIMNILYTLCHFPHETNVMECIKIYMLWLETNCANINNIAKICADIALKYFNQPLLHYIFEVSKSATTRAYILKEISMSRKSNKLIKAMYDKYQDDIILLILQKKLNDECRDKLVHIIEEKLNKINK